MPGLLGGWEGHEMRNDPLPVRQGDLQIAFRQLQKRLAPELDQKEHRLSLSWGMKWRSMRSWSRSRQSSVT